MRSNASLLKNHMALVHMTFIDRHLHTGFETWQQTFKKIKPVEKILSATAMSLNFNPFTEDTWQKNGMW